MTDVPRVTAQEVRGRQRAKKAWLVCAYESDEMFRKAQLDGALSLSQFQERLPMLPRATEIVFYCA
ncbi:hypothetical protein SAMN05216233_13516 [Desulfoluna spongiiphila]|uniref:ArsR family transcriptional regulator n=2 Tax=Desulfoluna spongiiphila TaxID=419481 RepID=A0A1G5JN92_9BACT|nr:hypothetical protein SAMN05216233_13516 [Desulfoluna spongiiphila]VVS93038.1 rhodanese-like domain superfamily [Desulfoluna spongiiphila]